MLKIHSFILLVLVGIFSFQNKKIETKKTDSAQKTTVADTLTWKLVSQVKFFKKQQEGYGLIDFPMVSPTVKKHSGKKIFMSGFIVPIDNENYALSKNVFASCFFCGKAGPETIMGIKFKGGKIKLKTDQYVTLEGNFRINETNVEDWIYHIENAIIVKGN